MDRNASGTVGWTRERVELRLVAAFRAMPGLPVLSRGASIRTAIGERTTLTEVLEWVSLCAEADRKFLMTWARCRATRDSFADRCRHMGWSRSSAEDGRRRAALAIASSLNAVPFLDAGAAVGLPAIMPLEQTLDSRTTLPGPFAHIAVTPEVSAALVR